jgi:hypothetical protein
LLPIAFSKLCLCNPTSFIPVTDAGFFIRFNNKMCTGTLLDRDRKRSSLSFKLMFASACGVTSLAITATPSISPFILRCA